MLVFERIFTLLCNYSEFYLIMNRYRGNMVKFSK